MVMEMPSAQCVGQEFVRQYYTLLHEAPDYMHRFYSHDSSFVHGGIEKPGEELPPITGQAAIHKKILSLNFRDCHAKIRQVDSQATIERAVVVQVAGELSNAGQPMRRFMQTFVLAPQSPKKYYVHNDIFRYQDEVFHDATTDSELEVAELDMNESLEEVTETYDEQDLAVPSSNGNVNSGSIEPSEPTLEPPAVSTLTIAAEPELQSVDDNVELLVDAESVGDIATTSSTEVNQPMTAKADSPVPTSDSATVRTTSSPSLNTVASAPLSEVVKVASEPQKQVSWAALASKNTPAGGMSQTAGPAAVSKPQATVKPEIKPELSASVGPLPQRPPLPQCIERTPVEHDSIGTFGSHSGGDGEDTMRRIRYADNLQVFVGNLPHIVSDHELRQYFEKFGNVIDVRVNRRGPSKDVPNFAFVVFDNPETAQKVLESRPLFILDGKLRLNIEEKKQQTDYRAGGALTRSGPRGSYRSYQPNRGSGPPHGIWRGHGRGPRGYSQGRSSDEEYSGDDHGGFEHSPSHLQ